MGFTSDMPANEVWMFEKISTGKRNSETVGADHVEESSPPDEQADGVELSSSHKIIPPTQNSQGR